MSAKAPKLQDTVCLLRYIFPSIWKVILSEQLLKEKQNEKKKFNQDQLFHIHRTS